MIIVKILLHPCASGYEYVRWNCAYYTTRKLKLGAGGFHLAAIGGPAEKMRSRDLA